jgi:hypothetical protein
VSDPGRARQQLVADMRRVRRDLVERFDRTQVDLYYATLDGDRAVFDAIS